LIPVRKVLLLDAVEAKFCNFFSPHFRNRLRKCRDVVADQHFFKGLRTAEKIAISEVRKCNCGATALLKLADLKLRTADKDCDCVVKHFLQLQKCCLQVTELSYIGYIHMYVCHDKRNFTFQFKSFLVYRYVHVHKFYRPYSYSIKPA
jgi:hypothetical protein